MLVYLLVMLCSTKYHQTVGVRGKLEKMGKLGLAVLSQNSSGKIINTKEHNDCGQVLYQTRMQVCITTGITDCHICGTPSTLNVCYFTCLSKNGNYTHKLL
jgi:hypothetical protein